MKKIDKIILIGFLSAIIVIVGLFLFGHFPQSVSPAVGITHAQDLHTDLVNSSPSQPTAWVFTIWKVALALANVVVIVMLLFVAIVNIVHLQYDTYAIKKSLPLLIIGIIMANFSLLICRMIVDSAQVLANTFAGNPKDLAYGLLCSMGVVVRGSSMNITLIPSILATGLIIMIFVFILILIAVFILAFLLWFRKTVIFLLVAVAPVAFILYAFPPTQGLFKKWWSWFLKWTFMGPIVMFLVWAASQIGKTNCASVTGTGTFSISALFATCGVLYLAAIVPFKLGGPVMSAWGGAGKWASMMGKGGAIRKKVDANIQRKKDAVNGAVGQAIGNTRFGRWSDSGLKAEEGLIANYKTRRDTQLDTADRAAKNRHPNWDADEIRADRAKKNLQRDKEGRNATFYRTPEGRTMINEEVNDQMATGRLTIAKQDQMFTISLARGREISEFKNSVANSQKRVEKLDDDQTVGIAKERLSNFDQLPDTLRRASRAVDDAQVARGMVHPDDAQGIIDAQQNLNDATDTLDNERNAHVQYLQTQGNHHTGQNYTQDEAMQHVETNLLQQYQVTRNYAIIGKRVADDAATDAQSQDSSVIASSYLNQHDEAESGSYSGMTWHVDEAGGHALHAFDPATGQPTGQMTVNAQGQQVPVVNDMESFFHGQRLAEGSNSLGIATGLSGQKLKMTNNRTMGYAMQDYMRMASAGNAAGMRAVIHQAKESMTQAERTEFEDRMHDKGIQGTTAEDYRQFITQNALETSTQGDIENKFATKLFGQLQRVDGAGVDGQAQIQDETGASHTVVTGLGRQAWWYARHL